MLGGSEEDNEEFRDVLCCGRDSNWGSSEHKSELLLMYKGNEWNKGRKENKNKGRVNETNRKKEKMGPI
jgi:hypothetical protein